MNSFHLHVTSDALFFGDFLSSRKCTCICSLAFKSAPTEDFCAMDAENKKESSERVDDRNDPSPAYGFKTTTLEKWSYIAYYVGNNGLSGFVYGAKKLLSRGFNHSLMLFCLFSRPLSVSESSRFGRQVRSQRDLYSSFFRAAANRFGIAISAGTGIVAY